MRYYYAGIKNTAKVARKTSAVITVGALPTNCVDCRAVGWVSLDDPDESGQWVKAGLGYSSSACSPEKEAQLWLMSKDDLHEEVVDCVPLGMRVKVSILKEDGKQEALVTWELGLDRWTRVVALPGWVNGPGKHPAKVEVVSPADKPKPRPVSIGIGDILLYPEDSKVEFQSSFPYQLSPIDYFRAFSVEYNPAHPYARIQDDD